MTSAQIGRPGVVPRNGRQTDYNSSSSAKVIALPSKLNRPQPFASLTARLVMARHQAGTLDPAIVAALLAAVDLNS